MIELVDTQRRWSEIWKVHTSRVHPPPPLPNIDFSIEAVFVAALGDRPSGGYLVSLAATHEDFLKFQVIEIRPGDGCAVFLEITQPVAFAVLSAPTGYAEIATEVRREPCN